MTKTRSRSRGLDTRIATTRGSLPISLAAAAASGMAALTHELIWTRRMLDLLGASASSSARVFGCFFLGLALGSAWVSTRVGRWQRPYRAAAISEVLVALLSLPTLLLPVWSRWIWPSLGPVALTSSLGGGVKLLISALVIIPPSFAMGVFLPTLVAALCREGLGLEREGIWLYALNTLGGVLGIAAASLVWLPGLGVPATQLVVMGLNLLIASCLIGLDQSNRRPWRGSTRANANSSESGGNPSFSNTSHHLSGGLNTTLLTCALAFLSGLLVLAAEVVGLQLVMLAAPLTFHAPGAILGLVIAMLGLSALAVPSLLGSHRSARSLVIVASSAAGVFAAIAPVIFLVMAALLGNLVDGGGMPSFFFKLSALVTVSLGPLFLASGFLLPATLSFKHGTASLSSPGRLGVLLACNGAGGFLGAEIVGFQLMSWLGVHLALAALGAVYSSLATALALLTPASAPAKRKLLRTGSLTSLLVVFVLAATLVRSLPHMSPGLPYQLLDETYGREGVLSVIEGEETGRSLLLSNQYVLGGTSVRWDQERQAHIPLMLHRAPREVAFLGLATGITPGAALDHSAVESVTAIEISPLVASAARAWFGEFNHHVSTQTRARVVVEDGRTYLASCTSRFDVIVGDLFLPWGPGEGRLFSVEHFADIRKALRPGGLYCQWLPLFQLTPEHLRWILASFRDSFPTVHLVINGFGVKRPVLGLLGGAEDWSLDWLAVQARCASERRFDRLRDPLARHAEGLSLLYLGRWKTDFPPEAPRNTLGNMRLELNAGQERITGLPGRKYLHSSSWLAWLDQALQRNLDRDNASPLAEPKGPDGETLGLTLALLEQDLRQPDSGRPGRQRVGSLPERLTALLPRPILLDQRADWGRWPGPPPFLALRE